MSATQRLKRVVCLGDSITRGQVSVNYVELLRQRLSAERFGFANHGVNYDLAYNALARLDDVLAEEPDHVTVLLGTNDTNASLHERNRKRLTRVRRLPTRPTREWYRANLTELVRRLQQHSHADVALLSLPVIGEQLDSESVRRAGEYSAVVREVAESNGAAYLPLYERQVEELRRHDRRPGTPYRAGLLLAATAATQHIVLRQSFDQISVRRGLWLTTDNIHQNSRGAGMIADLIAEHLTNDVPT